MKQNCYVKSVMWESKWSISWQKTAAQFTFASLKTAARNRNCGRMAGKEHLSTIEMEEEYIQSLVTGTLHRATKQPTQWSCVCPSEIDWHSHYAFTTLNTTLLKHMRSPRLLPVYRSRRRLHQYNLVTQSLIMASGLKPIILRKKNKQVLL